MIRPHVFARSRGGVLLPIVDVDPTPSPSPAPTPTPGPSPMAANIFNDTDLTNFFANVGLNDVGVLQNGVAFSARSPSGKNLAAGAATLRCANHALARPTIGTVGGSPTNSPSLGLAGWQGLTLDGITFVHPDSIDVSAGASLVPLINSKKIAIRRCAFQGPIGSGVPAVAGLPKVDGIALEGSNIQDLEISESKFQWIHNGVYLNYGGGPVNDNILIQNSHFIALSADGVDLNGSTTNATLKQLLFEDFLVPVGTEAHPDCIQAYQASDQPFQNILFQDIVSVSRTDLNLMAGIHLASFAVNANIHINGFKGLGGSWTLVDVHGRDGTGNIYENIYGAARADAATVVEARFEWSSASRGVYRNITCNLLSNGSAPTVSLTDGGGNSAIPSLKCNGADINAAVAAQFAAFPLIPV